MEEELLVLETIHDMFLNKFTIEELIEKGIKECDFEWKFNFKNSNIIPVLELYDNRGNITNSIEATEFSEFLQYVLRNAQMYTNFFRNSEDINKLLKELDDDSDCDKCPLKDICPLTGD